MSLLDQFFILWTEQPELVWGFVAALLVAAFYFVFGAKVRVVHRPSPQVSLLASEQKAIDAERVRDHERRELRERASNLRLVSSQMTDDNDHEAA